MIPECVDSLPRDFIDEESQAFKSGDPNSLPPLESPSFGQGFPDLTGVPNLPLRVECFNHEALVPQHSLLASLNLRFQRSEYFEVKKWSRPYQCQVKGQSRLNRQKPEDR